MKPDRTSFSAASLAVLIIQLALVCAVAVSYAHQRQVYPRVWTRAYGFDPQSPLRGRYLSLQVAVDGCQSTLPSAAQAKFPRDVNGAAKPGPYTVALQVGMPAQLEVQNSTLQAVYIANEEQRRFGQSVETWPGKACSEMRLSNPVNFYIADTAPSLFPLKPSQELWIELTIPPQGPPRPIQLAVKDNGFWKPVANQ